MAKDYSIEDLEIDTIKIIKNYHVDGDGYYQVGIKGKVFGVSSVRGVRPFVEIEAKLGTAQETEYTDVEIFHFLKVRLGDDWKTQMISAANVLIGAVIS